MQIAYHLGYAAKGVVLLTVPTHSRVIGGSLADFPSWVHAVLMR